MGFPKAAPTANIKLRLPSCIAFLLSCLLASFLAHAADAELRLVSLAPSLTEMLYEIGAGDLLVGDTDQCRYPPEALAVRKVGGYQTPNLEAVLTLRPDLVLTLAEHSPTHAALDGLGIAYQTFDHRSLEGVLDSFTRLGVICGVAETAERKRRELASVLAPPPGGIDAARPSLLMVIGRDYAKGGIANAYVIGRDGLYEHIVTAAGFRNAYRGNAAYPVLSAEGVTVLNPDVIVEAVYKEMGTSLPPETLVRDWNVLPNLPAVRNRRIHYLFADYIYIPGYRMILLKRDLEALAAENPPAAGAP